MWGCQVLAAMSPKDKASALAAMSPTDRAAALEEMSAQRGPPGEPVSTMSKYDKEKLHADMEQSRSRRSGIGSEGENLKGIEEDGFLSGGSSLGDAVFTITNDVHERAEKSHDPRPQLWNSVR